MNSYKNEIEQLRCKFNTDDAHFYADARVLPCCSKLACLECILNDYTNGYLKCTYCARINKLNSVNELESNQLVSDEIISKSAELLDEIETKFRSDANQSKEKKLELINELCSRAKQDINERIECVYDHLDALRRDFNETLKSIKEKAYLEYNQLESSAQVRLDQFDQFLKSEFTELELTQHKLLKFQQYLNDLNDLSEKFKFLYRRIKFEASDWMPDEKFLCPSSDLFNKV